MGTSAKVVALQDGASRPDWDRQHMWAGAGQKTHRRASAGQSENQLMVQQLTRAGSWRQRSLKLSPMGLMHSTMCSLARTRSTKAFHRGPGRSGMPWAIRPVRASSRSLLRSSSANSPVASAACRCETDSPHVKKGGNMLVHPATSPQVTSDA